jgi:hypothetical protein
MPDQQLDQTAQLSPVAATIMGIVALAVLILMIASMWKIFAKAGEPGWAAIVPIYNTIVFLKIAGKPLWWIVLLFIPGVNFIVAILALVTFVERFGKGAGYVIGILFLGIIFLPMLAFGDAQYIGPKTA